MSNTLLCHAGAVFFFPFASGLGCGTEAGGLAGRCAGTAVKGEEDLVETIAASSTEDMEREGGGLSGPAAGGGLR